MSTQAELVKKAKAAQKKAGPAASFESVKIDPANIEAVAAKLIADGFVQNEANVMSAGLAPDGNQMQKPWFVEKTVGARKMNVALYYNGTAVFTNVASAQYLS